MYSLILGPACCTLAEGNHRIPYNAFNNPGASMRLPAAVFLAVFSASSRVSAGELYGTITDGTKPVGGGVKMEISSSGKVYSTETDKFGSYRIFVKEKGKCTFTVYLKDHTAAVELFSYDKSTRYDWICEMQGGKALLRRK
jgi:hypothetical protein